METNIRLTLAPQEEDRIGINVVDAATKDALASAIAAAQASATEAKKSENQVKNAITEANYQLLYLENGRLMLYKSDATSHDLDFRIKDHKNLEVTFL